MSATREKETKIMAWKAATISIPNTYTTNKSQKYYDDRPKVFLKHIAFNN